MRAFGSRVSRLVLTACLAAGLSAKPGGTGAGEANPDATSAPSPYATAQMFIAAGFKDDEFIRFAADSDRTRDEQDYDVQVAVLAGQGDIAGAFRLGVLALIALPADEKFPQRLTRALALVEYSERGTGVPIGDNWVMPLFVAAAALPHELAAFQNARWVHAAHLGVRRDFAGERGILESLLREPDLLDEFRPKIHAALGYVLEQLGEPSLAAHAYARLVDEPLPAIEQCNALLRAALLHLHVGDPRGARRMLNSLAATDPWARACATGAQQIEQLLQFHTTGRTEYWTRSGAWWPRWERLVAKLELPAEGPETTAPVIANDLAIRIALKPAIETYDRKALFQELRRVMSAARWMPGYVTQLGPLIYSVDRIAPEVTGDFRAVVIALLEATRDLAEPSRRREADLALAIAYADDRQPAKALPLIDALRGQCGDDFDFKARLARVHAVAALAGKQQLPQAAAGLEGVLAAAGPVRDRAELVTIASDVYATLKDYAAERRLLEREVEQPDVKSAARDYGRLLARLELTRLLTRDDASEPVPDPAAGSAPPDVGPRLLRRVEPAFSDALRTRGITGKAVMEFLVSANGRVIAVRPRFATHAVLGDLAAAAVARWEFEPARRNGKRVSMRMLVPLYFPAAGGDSEAVASSAGRP